MKTYNVTVSASGYFHTAVKANSPEEAIELAAATANWELSEELEGGDDYEAEEL